jgi:methionine-rich copper-binding protein CopC
MALLLVPGTAQAHSGLSSSSPAADSTVTEPLTAVELTFAGSVRLREVGVTGPDGASAGSAPPTASGAVVTAAVSLSAPGRYTVTYAVTSDDGHPVDGSLSFSYAPPATAAPTTSAPVTTAAPATSSAAPAPVEPSEAAASNAAEESGGFPGWVIPVAVAVVGAGVVLAVRRMRS